MAVDIVAMVLLEDVTDRRLQPEVLDAIEREAHAATTVRQAVIDNLPRLTRVIALMPPEHARNMMQANDIAMTRAGNPPMMPHPDYVAPKDQGN